MFVFRLKRTVKLGVKSLWMHRLRSTLTTLGIIFGVASVIAMLAIGEGASRDAQEQIARLGSRNVIIKTVKPPEEQDASGETSTMLDYGLTYSDAERFRNGIPDVEVIVPIRRLTEQAWYRNRKASVEVVGTVPWHPDTSPIKLKMASEPKQSALKAKFLSGKIKETSSTIFKITNSPLSRKKFKKILRRRKLKSLKQLLNKWKKKMSPSFRRY